MRKVTMLLAMVIMPLVASAQWDYAGNFPSDSLKLDQASTQQYAMTGIAVDGEGKVWFAPYYYQSDTLTISVDNYNGTADTTLTNQRMNFVWIYNADGTQASFSPLTYLEDKSGNVVDTLGGEVYRNADGFRRYGYNTNRGLRATIDGNIVVTTFTYARVIDHTDGTLIAKRNAVQDGIGATGGLTGPTVDGAGNIYVHAVFPGNPIIQYDSNLENPQTVWESSPGFSRSNLISEDGLTMYFPAYSAANVYVYSRSDEFSAFVLADSIYGVKTESLTFSPDGKLWVSGGSFNDFPVDGSGYMPKVHYAFDTSNLSAAPSDSIRWFDQTFYADDSRASAKVDGRPRGIAFSADGTTAYLGQFNDTNKGLQKFTKSETSVEREFNANGFELSQNYPNPFNPSTAITFTMGKASTASLKVYDGLGREVATLVNGFKNAGQHTVSFDASNLASGTYIYILQAGNTRLVNKMTLIK